MKAAVLVQNKKIEVKDLELGQLESDCCRVKILYSGVCSSDIQRAFDGGAYFYPLVMGHEIAGEIVQAGSEVKNFKAGDKVGVFPLLPCKKCSACKNEIYAQCHDYDYYGSRRNGGFSEYLDIKAWNLIKVPEKVDIKDVVALEPMAVALHALNRANILENPPKTMAIIGAGFIGLIAAQIVVKKCPQTKLTLIDRNQFKLDILKDKANTVLLKTDEEWINFISKNSFEVVLEATGSPKSFEHSTNITNRNGITVWMGNITDDLVISKKNVSSILRKELKIIGVWNSIYKPGQADDWKEALSLIEEGIHPCELVSHWISLNQIEETLAKLFEHKKGNVQFPSVKIVIKLKDEK